jgi:hypothetical protein
MHSINVVKQAGVVALAALAVVAATSVSAPGEAQAKIRQGEVCVPGGSEADDSGTITVYGHCYDLNSGSPPPGSYPTPPPSGPIGDPPPRGSSSLPEYVPVNQVPLIRSETYGEDQLKARGYTCNYTNKLPASQSSSLPQSGYFCIKGSDIWKCEEIPWWKFGFGERDCKAYRP